MKWHTDAQANRAGILQSTAAAPEPWAGVPWAPFPLEPSLRDGCALVTPCCVTGTEPVSGSWRWEVFLDLTA